MLFLINAAVNWAKVGIVLGIVAGLAVLFAVLILVVTKVCKIKEDEKVLKILENLAGANCGGCGHTGCEGFAKSLAEGKACLSDCKVTSNEAKAVIAKIAGIPYEADEPTVAVVRCSGGVNAADKYTYVGNPGCINENVYQGGRKLCATGCLGGGTCVDLCPVGAIKIGEGGAAYVDRALCTSCGLCIAKCPKHCIDRIPVSAKVYVGCSTHCKGKETTSFCKVGCIGCGICAKNCPQGAITMVDNLPVIDYKKCTGCLTCVAKCPRHIIRETAKASEPLIKADLKHNK
jgi:electron transport complex protein RnfB